MVSAAAPTACTAAQSGGSNDLSGDDADRAGDVRAVAESLLGAGGRQRIVHGGGAVAGARGGICVQRSAGGDDPAGVGAAHGGGDEDHAVFLAAEIAGDDLHGGFAGVRVLDHPAVRTADAGGPGDSVDGDDLARLPGDVLADQRRI